MAPDLAFDAVTHTYRVGDRIVPSVTQVLRILQDFSHVDPQTLERARELGTNVHSMIELDVRGELDRAALDPNLVPYLASWHAFLQESGFVVTASEQRVYHAKLGYAGTIDLLGEIDGVSWVIDVKTGMVPETVGPQLAAYQAALDPKPKKRGVLRLTAEKYSFAERRSPSDFVVFQSALNLHRWKHAS